MLRVFMFESTRAGSGSDSATADWLATARPQVPFTSATHSVDGLSGLIETVQAGALKAGGTASTACAAELGAHLGSAAVLMVNSCTTALELAALLLDVGPGDEVILPSFAFPSAASAFALRGATPVFADIDAHSYTLDPASVRAAISPRTRAIVVIHYAGSTGALDELVAIAGEHGVPLVEDAAQALGSTYRGRPLGSIGALAAFSFDATKNLSCGSGGALAINDAALVAPAERARDYGTDRAQFMRGERARYEWVDLGTNAAINELAAAYLLPQLRDLPAITQRRLDLWEAYHLGLSALEEAGRIRRPLTSDEVRHNAHLYPVQLAADLDRSAVIAGLAERGVQATFHFTPLHSAPAGLRLGRTAGPMRHTDACARQLLRLPLTNDMPCAAVDHVIEALTEVTHVH